MGQKQEMSSAQKISGLIVEAKSFHDLELAIENHIRIEEGFRDQKVGGYNCNSKILEKLYNNQYSVGIKYDNAIMGIWLEYAKLGAEEKEMFRQKITSEYEKLEATRKNDANVYVGRDVYSRILNEVINVKSTASAAKK